MSYYDSPFESVRGPVITAFDQAVPKVSGQGGAWAGYGKLKVETQIVHVARRIGAAAAGPGLQPTASLESIQRLLQAE
jgi:hypothetical protein